MHQIVSKWLEENGNPIWTFIYADQQHLKNLPTEMYKCLKTFYLFCIILSLLTTYFKALSDKSTKFEVIPRDSNVLRQMFTKKGLHGYRTDMVLNQHKLNWGPANQLTALPGTFALSSDILLLQRKMPRDAVWLMVGAQFASSGDLDNSQAP